MENWKTEAVVKEWQKQVEPQTFQKYSYAFEHWLNFIGMTPTEQYNKRVEDLQSREPKTRAFFEEKTKDFVRHMARQQDFSEATLRNYAKVVQSFMASNRVHLKFRRGELQRLFRQLAKKQKPIKKLPTNEELRAIYSHASMFMKPAILLSYQSGFDGKDITSMQIEEVFENGELPKEKRHQFVRYNRQKTGISTYTCFSIEALHDIETVLRKRGYPKSGHLLTSVHGKQLSSKTLNDEFTRLSKEATGKHYTFKSLRKCYKRAMNNSKIEDEEVKKVLMGHDIGVEANYSLWDTNPEPIIEAFDKIFPRTSINGMRQERDDLKVMREELEKRSKQIELLKSLLSEELIERARKQGKLDEYLEVFK